MKLVKLSGLFGKHGGFRISYDGEACEACEAFALAYTRTRAQETAAPCLDEETRKQFRLGRKNKLHKLHNLPRYREKGKMKASQEPSQKPPKLHSSKEKPLREQMPQCSAWIDNLREAFGAELIDGQIKAGMKGEAVFFASENGIELGTRDDRPAAAVSFDARGVATVRRSVR